MVFQQPQLYPWLNVFGAELVLFPEAFLGTYPKGLTFDAPVGRRLPEGREDFLRYYNGAVEIGGPEVRDIEKAARQHNIFVVLGIIERGGSTLYCTIVFIDPQKGLVGRRRKLMPTAGRAPDLGIRRRIDAGRR